MGNLTFEAALFCATEVNCVSLEIIHADVARELCDSNLKLINADTH
jgi:hypothetical protein